MAMVRQQLQFHYLPPSVLDTLHHVELIARGLVEGSLAGLHRSPYLGFSSEFSEYRKYCPGDPIKALDWVVYLRTDRYYIKQFQAETNSRVFVLLDQSASMTLGAKDQRKFNYACYLAAAFLYLAQRQRDAIGLATFSDRVHEFFPARTAPAHLRRLLLHLEGLKPAGPSQASACFARLAEAIPRRSLVVIFTDCLDRDPAFMRQLEQFRYNQCELVLFQVLDPKELTFPYQGLVEFRDLETQEVIEVDAEDYREAYLAELERYNQQLKSVAERMNIWYERLSTETPFERALMGFFHKREKLF